ncbi:hypothetical protein [Actinosynnema mirum]|uniref:hypothetical protein n=1 Tax=Actinosynnema mirum TaxID=40567 RepID=UPI00019ABF5C
MVGVPAGALLGDLWGWRSAFRAVALLTAPALVAVLRSVPAGGGVALAEGARATLLVSAALTGGALVCGSRRLAATRA